MKNKKVDIFIIAIFIYGLLITSLPFQVVKEMLLGFLDPHREQRITENYQNKSSYYLLYKLIKCEYIYSNIAADILIERKDEKAIPIFLLYSKSPFWIHKEFGIKSLVKMGDRRAIVPLLNIVKKGPEYKNYLESLDLLSQLQYEPIFPLIVKLLDSCHKEYAIEMVANFNKASSLNYLEKIAENDNDKYIREDARKAIDKIKSQMKSP